MSPRPSVLCAEPRWKHGPRWRSRWRYDVALQNVCASSRANPAVSRGRDRSGLINNLIGMFGEDLRERPVGISVNEAQNRPETLQLLAASLQCDRIARRWQATYVLGLTLGLVLVTTDDHLMRDLMADLVGGLQALGLLFAYGRSVRWREHGSSLRADFERLAFGFPDWTNQSDLTQRRSRRLASTYLRGQRRRDGLRDWFDIPSELPHEQEVLLCEYQSTQYGQHLRRVWAVMLTGAGIAAAATLLLVAVVRWPLTAQTWHVVAVAVTVLPTLFKQAANAWRYADGRREIAKLIERVGSSIGTDMKLVVHIVHERLVGARRSRVIVPQMLYIATRGYMRRNFSDTPPFLARPTAGVTVNEA